MGRRRGQSGPWRLLCGALIVVLAALTAPAASTEVGARRPGGEPRAWTSRRLLIRESRRSRRPAAGPERAVTKLRVRATSSASRRTTAGGAIGKMISRSKLSLPEWGAAPGPALQARCSQGNLSSALHLRSMDLMHLAYPKGWRDIDFIFHKEYGKEGQPRLPALVNKLTDSLMGELSHVLIPEEEFRKQYDTSSCALVLSSDDSPALFRSSHGDAIDKHTAVFRIGQFNSASRMTSFADIGAKTTFRVFTMMHCLKLLEMRGTGKRQNILNLEKGLTILMFNAKAKTESAMKGWVVMYVRLRNALKEAGRRDISVHLMSPLPYAAAKHLSLDTAECLTAGGAQVGCRTPAPTSRLTTAFAAAHLCNSLTLYGDFSKDKMRKDTRTCGNVQLTVLRSLAANKVLTLCGSKGCSSKALLR